MNPPSYTRKPPIYLALQDKGGSPRSVSAPQGSEFFLRYIGEGEVELVAKDANADSPVAPLKQDYRVFLKLELELQIRFALFGGLRGNR